MTRIAGRALAAAAILAALPAFAPIEPKHQRLREIQAVIRRAADLLPDPIEAVEMAETDLVRVRTARCTLDVRILDARPAARSVSIPGRRRFRISPGAPHCP